MSARNDDPVGSDGGRPDLLASGAKRLTRIERAQITAVRRTLEPGPLDDAMRWCQRNLGAKWITFVTDRLRHEVGLERIPELDIRQSYLCVANHRSFFDLYIVMSQFMRRGLPHRIFFPVRANFFYDSPFGFVVNGLMSFFAMYPPIFRDPKRAALNLVGLDETAWLLRRGGAFVGIHPEGTRGRGDDPYSFLPAQSGVGRIIHHARVPVLPVFINGPVNDIVDQVRGNFGRTGPEVIVVYGSPIDFGDMLEQRGSPRIYKRIAERAMEVIGELGAEERELRRKLSGGNVPGQS